MKKNIVKFVSKNIRDKILENRKMKIQNNKIIKDGGENLIFINENLTRYYENLLCKTKMKCREINFKYSWVKYGKIYVRKDESSRIIRIRAEEDLAGLL